MATTWSRVSRVVILLLVTQLSACYDPDNKPATTTLDSFPKGIAFDNEDNLYIATVTGNIFRFDGQQQQLSKILNRGDHGLDLAENIRYSQNNLYIHNKHYAGKKAGYIDEILLFSTTGEFINRLVTENEVKASNFRVINVNNRGQLYSVSDAPIEKVFRINPDKGGLTKFDFSVSQFTTETQGLEGDDSTLGNNDELSLAEEVSQLTALLADIPPELIDNIAPLLVMPTGIVSGQTGNLYVSFILGIVKYDIDGHRLQTVAKAQENGFGTASKMTVDPYGNLVVVNVYYENNTSHINILKFSPDGQAPRIFIPAGTITAANSIQDIAFDSAGNFYLVDTLKGIYKFDQSGQFVDIIVKPF